MPVEGLVIVRYAVRGRHTPSPQALYGTMVWGKTYSLPASSLLCTDLEEDILPPRKLSMVQWFGGRHTPSPQALYGALIWRKTYSLPARSLWRTDLEEDILPPRKLSMAH